MTLLVAKQSTNVTDLVDFDVVPHWYMYPPKGCYKDGCNHERLVEALASLSGPVSLYVHIPFCTMKCSFCSLFASVATTGTSVNEYIGCLIEEANLLSSHIDSRSLCVRNLYIGGGTPSILTEPDTRRLIDHLRETFTLDENAILSVEFSPDTVDASRAALWSSLGATRASLGIQSFNDELLKSMRRRHSGYEARVAVEVLLRAGLHRLNVDLIYGHVSQRVNDWTDDLTTALQCGANSVTIHPLAVRERTGYKKQLSKAHVPPSTPNLPELYQIALRAFQHAAWLPTSAVAFSNSDNGNPLEEAEGKGIPTLGLGAGARTYLSRLHTSSISYIYPVSVPQALSDYGNALRHGRLPVASSVELTAEEQIRRRFLLSLLGRGIDTQIMSSLKNDDVALSLRTTLTELQMEGLVHQDQGRITLTDNGLLQAATVGLRLASSTVQQTIS